MLNEQPALTESAEPCAAPPLAVQHLPIALVTEAAEGTSALVGALSRHPVATFTSLGELCAELEEGSKWAGVVISGWCVWDSRVQEHMPNLSAVALFGYAEGFGWPEEVRRLSGQGELEAWLEQLEEIDACSPPPGTPDSVEPQAQSMCGEQMADSLKHEEPSAAQQSPSEGNAERPEQDAASQETRSRSEPPAAEPAPQPAPRERVLATKLSRRRQSATTREESAHEVRADGARHTAEAQITPRRAAKARPPVRRTRDSDANREQKRSDAGHIDRRGEIAQQELMKLALKIGLRRARELMEQLRARAQHLLEGSSL